MNCRECQDKLNEYLDGELSAEKAAAIEEHTSQCSQCAEELEGLRQTIDALHDLPRHEAPVDLADEVTGSLPARRTSRIFRLWVPGAVAAAAAVLLAVFFAPGFMSQKQMMREAPQNAVEKSGSVSPRADMEMESAARPEPAKQKAMTADTAPEGAKGAYEVVVLRTSDVAALHQRIRQSLGGHVVADGGRTRRMKDGEQEMLLQVSEDQYAAVVERLRGLAAKSSKPAVSERKTELGAMAEKETTAKAEEAPPRTMSTLEEEEEAAEQMRPRASSDTARNAQRPRSLSYGRQAGPPGEEAPKEDNTRSGKTEEAEEGTKRPPTRRIIVRIVPEKAEKTEENDSD
jgi:hypothetical protein